MRGYSFHEEEAASAAREEAATEARRAKAAAKTAAAAASSAAGRGGSGVGSTSTGAGAAGPVASAAKQSGGEREETRLATSMGERRSAGRSTQDIDAELFEALQLAAEGRLPSTAASTKVCVCVHAIFWDEPGYRMLSRCACVYV